MKKLISKITQTILIIAFIYCLLSDQWKIASYAWVSKHIFLLVPVDKLTKDIKDS